MRLRDLTTGEMISVSAPMVAPTSGARKAIESSPATAGLVAQLEEAHRGVEKLVRPPPPTALGEISKRLAELDLRHDNIARGVQSVLIGLIYLTTDLARAQELARLKDFLVGDNLAFIARSYLDEAGRLLNLKSTATPALQRSMTSVRVDDVTLLDRFEEWCDIGQQMQVLDLERASLEGAQPLVPTRAGNLASRNQWIRVMNALVEVADLAQLSPETRTAIFGQLDSLLARTAKRDKKSAPEATPPQPANTPPNKPVREE